MTQIDCEAIFNLQLEIIDAEDISDAQKLKMLKGSIKKTLGETEKGKE
ncbi:MAG: hypothetical protein FWF77_05285 [Defluviitaleaceae bacterium]|nr:hypothetical protein [Defluviitaleaceae bacterium]